MTATQPTSPPKSHQAATAIHHQADGLRNRFYLEGNTSTNPFQQLAAI